MDDLYRAPEIYDIAFSWEPTVEMQFYVDLLKDLDKRTKSSSQRIAEFGCGTGRILRALSQMPFFFLGIDISTSMSRYAYHKGAPHMADVITADMVFLPLKANSFVAAISTLSSVNYLKSMHAIASHLMEANRVLVKGGIYIIDFLLGVPQTTEEEWQICRDGFYYDIKWQITNTSQRAGKLSEKISIRAGSVPLFQSKSFLTIIEREKFCAVIKHAGFYVSHWFQPFVRIPLENPPTEGRVVIVLKKLRAAP